MKVFTRRDFPAHKLQQLLQEANSVTHPQDPRALKLSPQSRLTIHHTTLSGRRYYLCIKEYPYRGFFHTLKSSFKPSRARAFWKGGWGLKVRGFQAPEAYLMWEERRLGVIVSCGVVMEAVEDALGLDRYVSRRFSPPLDRRALKRKRRLIYHMARIIAGLHRKGVFHRDLKAGNILVREEGDGPKIIFLDLDAVRFKGSVSRRHIVLNLAQLDASIPPCISGWDRLRFLLAYWNIRAEELQGTHRIFGTSTGRKGLRALATEVAHLSSLRRGGRS